MKRKFPVSFAIAATHLGIPSAPLKTGLHQARESDHAASSTRRGSREKVLPHSGLREGIRNVSLLA